MGDLNQLACAMVEYERGCPKRIQHFIKVHGFARLIGEAEGLDAKVQDILEAAALVHDIGIRPALEKYASSSGPFQEREGIAPAREMLASLNFEEALIDRVCFLVAHHHTYTGVDGLDYQILLEADFLVNAGESGYSRTVIEKFRQRVFRTKSGTRLLDSIYLASEKAAQLD